MTSPANGFTPFYRGGDGTPLLLIHGITDTWRTWELVLPALERERDVFAPTLLGHAGGPELTGDVTDSLLADDLERRLDEIGWDTVDIAGNSLGGYLALQLAARGRARSVVALAPAGGWMPDDEALTKTLSYFRTMSELLAAAVPHADAIVSSPEGRRRATEFIATNYEHIPAELIAHQMRGANACDALFPLLEYAEEAGWELDAERIECPVRIAWGTDDRILHWPRAAERYRQEWLPNADWVELDGIGHCPQLDVPAEAAALIAGFSGASR